VQAVVRVVSTEQFDLLNLDFSWYFANAAEATFTKNGNFQANGVTYQDLLLLNGRNAIGILDLFILGNGMSQDSSGRIISGTVNFIGGGKVEEAQLYGTSKD
jgi:hypothetical protein